MGLPASFLHGGRTQESWYYCFILPQTLHGLRLFISPCLIPQCCPGNGSLLPTISIGSHVVLGQWICLSAPSPLEHREASWCISCKPCWLLSLIQRR